MTILFDLDGTLLDTSHDLIGAVNTLLQEENEAPVSYEYVRPVISFGGKRIISHAFKLDPKNNSKDSEYLEKLLPRYLELYKNTNFKNTVPFPGINELLSELEKINLTWGIVTNKIKSLTEPLLKNTGFYDRTACLVCGDTTNNSKPHPEPLYYACKLLNTNPEKCLYVGDSETDIQAGKAAGMATLAVGFGYIPTGVNIADWQANYSVNTAYEILPWIKKWSKQQA